MRGTTPSSLGFAGVLAIGLAIAWLAWSIVSQLVMVAALAHLLSDSGHACSRADSVAAVTAATSLRKPLARSLRPGKA